MRHTDTVNGRRQMAIRMRLPHQQRAGGLCLIGLTCFCLIPSDGFHKTFQDPIGQVCFRVVRKGFEVVEDRQPRLCQVVQTETLQFSFCGFHISDRSLTSLCG
jgi:hypothetical protein